MIIFNLDMEFNEDTINYTAKNWEEVERLFILFLE
jgi:hypothetical protein